MSSISGQPARSAVLATLCFCFAFVVGNCSAGGFLLSSELEDIRERIEKADAAELGALEGFLEKYSFGVLHVPGGLGAAHQAQRLIKSLPDAAWMISMFSVQFLLAVVMASIGLLLAVRSWWRPIIVPPVALGQLGWALVSSITGVELLEFAEPRIGAFLARYLAVLSFVLLFVFPVVLAVASLRPQAWQHFHERRKQKRELATKGLWSTQDAQS